MTRPRAKLRRVNVGSLKPVPDPFRARSRTADPDECGPPCPDCASADTWWFTEPRTTRPVLVCRACIESDGCDAGEPNHG